MTHLLSSIRHGVVLVTQPVQVASSRQFDWAATLLNAALVGGVYLDAWAHEHGRVDNTFFTPWHGILYTAMLAVGLFLFIAWFKNVVRGVGWRRALPAGYGLSLLGTLVFALGGIGDLIWHTLFGIEVDLEALLSPTHLVLALGSMLIVSGPFRAAWQRPDGGAMRDRVASLPRSLTLALMLSVFTFFTSYANPFGHPLAATTVGAPQETTQALGVAGVLIQPALLMGLVLLALRRWALPAGSLTLILTINAAASSVHHDQYRLIAVAAVAGAIADLLNTLLKPSLERQGALRLFAFAVPAILYALYFLVLKLTVGIWWSIHLWIGAIVLAGIVGLLLSYLLAPPAAPREQVVA